MTLADGPPPPCAGPARVDLRPTLNGWPLPTAAEDGHACRVELPVGEISVAWSILYDPHMDPELRYGGGGVPPVRLYPAGCVGPCGMPCGDGAPGLALPYVWMPGLTVLLPDAAGTVLWTEQQTAELGRRAIAAFYRRIPAAVEGTLVCGYSLPKPPDDPYTYPPCLRKDPS